VKIVLGRRAQEGKGLNVQQWLAGLLSSWPSSPESDPWSEVSQPPESFESHLRVLYATLLFLFPTRLWLCPVLPISVNSDVPSSVSTVKFAVFCPFVTGSCHGVLCFVFCKTLPCCWQNRTCRFYHRSRRVIAEALTRHPPTRQLIRLDSHSVPRTLPAFLGQSSAAAASSFISMSPSNEP
jgi:hypothetical protein